MADGQLRECVREFGRRQTGSLNKYDSIYTIEVPEEPVARKSFISKYRFATLCEEFCRDLHSRIFGAFATMGFDDDNWFSDLDLELLIQYGEKEIAQLRAEISLAESAKAADGTTGKGGNNLENKMNGVIKQMAPLRKELEKRKQAAATPVEHLESQANSKNSLPGGE